MEQIGRLAVEHYQDCSVLMTSPHHPLDWTNAPLYVVCEMGLPCRKMNKYTNAENIGEKTNCNYTVEYHADDHTVVKSII